MSEFRRELGGNRVSEVAGTACRAPRVPGVRRCHGQQEPANGTGDGDTHPTGNGAGREYKITATATELALNSTTATAVCKVPHH